MKVKKCPNCGAERIWEVHAWSGLRRYYRECAVCHWCSGNAFTRKGAKLRWNLQKRYISKH